MTVLLLILGEVAALALGAALVKFVLNPRWVREERATYPEWYRREKGWI